MPLYDYRCDNCGAFSAWRRMSEARAPSACPACGDSGRRVVSAPFLATMNPYNRIAHQRNEKSADEPKVMNREKMQRSGAKRSARSGSLSHGHDGGAGGHSHHHHMGRPWMIGH